MRDDANPNANHRGMPSFTTRLGDLGHVILWVSARKEMETIQVHGRDREVPRYIITAECSGCEYTKTIRGKSDYAGTRTSIKQDWRKRHAGLVPEDTPNDPPANPDIGIGRRAYEQAQRDAAAS